MSGGPITLRTEKGSRTQASLTVASAADAVRVVHELGDDDNVTVHLSRDARDGELLVAISRGRLLIGLTRSDGIYQHLAPEVSAKPPAIFLIGDQETEIDPRYVFDLPTGASAIRNWLKGVTEPPSPSWEKQ